MSQCQKNVVGEPFLVSEKFWDRNFWCIRAVSRFSVVILKFKDARKGWDANSYLALQNPVVLSTVPWELLEFLTNVSEIMKNFGTTETRTRTYCLRTLLSWTHCCHLFLNKKNRQFWTEKKRPNWMNNFSCLLHMRRKIINSKENYEKVFLKNKNRFLLTSPCCFFPPHLKRALEMSFA